MSQGNDRYRQAINRQTRQYQLSMDRESTSPETAQMTEPTPSTDEGLRVSIWDCLTVKYMDDDRRATLGALGIMAGYEVNAQ